MDSLCSSRATSANGFSEKGKSPILTAPAGDPKTLQAVEKMIELQNLQQSATKELSMSVQELCLKFGPTPMNMFGPVTTQHLQELKKDIFARLDSDALVQKASDVVVKNKLGALETLEQAVKGLVTVTTGRDTADSDKVASQLISLQTVLMDELRVQKETMTLLALQQDQFLQECRQMSALPSRKNGTTDPEATLEDLFITTPSPSAPNGVAPAPLESIPEQEQEGQTSKEENEFAVELVSKKEENEQNLDDDFDPTLAIDDDHVEETTPLVVNESGGLGAVFGNDLDAQKPAYHVEDFYYKKGCNQAIARADTFANLTVLVVVFNAVYIGFDSDYNDAQNIYEADAVFQSCSQFFCAYFTWELVVRFLAFERKCNAFKDGWFKFDTFLVSTMILDTWVLMPILLQIGGGVEIPTQPLRMLRLFKLTRMARLMKAFPELVTMIKGLVRSLRAISSSMILVGLMVYVWAIMMHMLMKEEYEFNEELWKDYQLGFKTMTQCIWTLLMAGTLMLDNASPVMSLLLFSDKMNYILAGFAFVAYAMLSAMCILQMLIGVLCDVVSTVKAEEVSASAVGLLRQEILKHLAACDDGDGKISQEELMKVIDSPRSRRLLRRLKINRSFLHQLQKAMYNKPGMQVPIKDVLDLMILSRGDNVTTVESMAGALVTIITEVSNTKELLDQSMSRLEKNLHADIRSSRMHDTAPPAQVRTPASAQVRTPASAHIIADTAPREEVRTPASPTVQNAVPPDESAALWDDIEMEARIGGSDKPQAPIVYTTTNVVGMPVSLATKFEEASSPTTGV